MAKQTFTTGQVLTAAQMTSLQQTAMGGGSPSVKTTSYVLVAADAGTVIQMNSASPTTITVNTALFAAGDTVFIQNIGAGACTVTAGTATVTTAGSLILTQWEGGTLYFTSTSAAIFFDYIQAGVSIPLTTKGDLFGYDTGNARVPIGTNGQVLTADSTQALGLKWATPASGGKVLQVVQASDSTARTRTATSFASASVAASITPSLTTSKVLVIVHLNDVYQSVGNSMKLRLVRGTTEIIKFASNNGYSSVTQTLYMGTNSTAYLDSPSTTSATTYTVEFASMQSGQTVGMSGADATSTITLLEIGA